MICRQSEVVSELCMLLIAVGIWRVITHQTATRPQSFNAYTLVDIYELIYPWYLSQYNVELLYREL
jgi:hypothetical protein